MLGARADRAPTLVLLHDGLGCVGRWRDFPDRLAAATGFGVFVYSRAGYGRSSPAPLPRPLGYMHDEARDVLPALLTAIGFRQGVLVGHSDGASIAAIHAGEIVDPRVRGLALIAPHFFTEDHGIASIALAREAYEQGMLRDALERWHDHVEVAFRGWNDAWLDPDFRRWDITESLSRIRVPILIVQGERDEFGTVRQIEVARERRSELLEVELVPGVGHMPQRDATDRTLAVIAGFAKRVAGVSAET